MGGKRGIRQVCTNEHAGNEKSNPGERESSTDPIEPLKPVISDLPEPCVLSAAFRRNRASVAVSVVVLHSRWRKRFAPPNYQVQRPATDLSARGRAALVCSRRLAARGQALYVSRFAATPS